MDRTIILVGVIFDDPSIDVLECRQLITAAKREGVVVVFRTKQGPVVAARNPPPTKRLKDRRSRKKSRGPIIHIEIN